MGDTSVVSYCIFVLVVVFLVRWRTHPLRCIPTPFGFSSPGLSYLTALYAMFRAKELVDAGVQKYYGSAFKVPLLGQWVVIVSGPNMVDELKKRPEDELSVMEGLLEVVQIKHIISRTSETDPAHSLVVHEKLSARTLATHVPEMIDELQLAAQDHLPSVGTDGWVSVHVLPVMHRIVARLCTRVFVGAATCRNEEYIHLASTFTVDLMKAGFVLGVLPQFLKPFIAPLVNSMIRTARRAMPHLSPVINERREYMNVAGSSAEDMPNDVLQWLIENAIRKNHTDAEIIESLFLVNLAAIHNTSNSLTHALYHLAECPQYLIPLRDEIEPIIAAEGWTSGALSKMEKLDSFLTECQRYTGIGLTSMFRKAVKDITLNDGTKVPQGTLVHLAVHSVHRNEAYYENAETFDPFRFARMREKERVEGSKYQTATPTAAYITFGLGHHACPGRFFATNQMKAVLAYIIVNFDLKFDGDGKRPPNLHFVFSVVPALDGRVMFRARHF